MNSPCARRIAALLTLFLILVPLWQSMEKAGPPQREGALLVYPELILKGRVPYRDFETPDGPANLYLLAAPYALFGADVSIERSVGVAYRLLLVGALFLLLQRRGVSLAVGGSVLAGVMLLATGAAAFSGLGAAACALWSLWCCTAPENRLRCLAAGLLAGLALLFQPVAGLAALVAILPLLPSMPVAHRRLLLLAASASLLPLAVLVGVAGPAPLLHGLLLPAGRFSGPLPALASTLLALHAAALLLNLAAGWLDRRELLAMALLSLVLTPPAMAHPDLLHLASVTFLSFALAPLSLAMLLGRLREKTPLDLGPSLAALAIVFLVFWWITPAFLRNAGMDAWQMVTGKAPIAFDLEGHGRRFPLPSAAAVMSAGPIVEDLEHLGKPGQRLFVGPGDLRQPRGSDTYFYHLLPQLVPASYSLELNFTTALPRLEADVATADWLILNRAWDAAPAEPSEVVRTLFERCARHGTWELYRRKARPQGT